MVNQNVVKTLEQRLKKYQDALKNMTESEDNNLASHTKNTLNTVFKTASEAYEKFKNASQEDYEELKKVAEEAFDKLKDELDKSSKNLVQESKKAFKEIQDYVEKNPMQSAAIAFGIGFIIAKIFKGSK